MKIIYGFIIFCLVLFIYLHINFHLKTSNDLEIFEIDQVCKQKMEDILDMRQPVLLDNDEDINRIVQTTNISNLLDLYPTFDVKTRNIGDKQLTYLPLSLRLANKLLEEDKESKYFSENNMEFLKETGAIKNIQYNDSFYRPNLVSNCNYDILCGSKGCTTPFRYEINYRNFFVVTQGSVSIKLSPPHSKKYLYPEYDYENFEFKSPINPWIVDKKYMADFEKVKCLEITLVPGKILYIPSYWWYSIKFSENTSITTLFYRTYMNNIAISPYIAMYMLQNQNIKRNYTKKIENNNKTNENNLNDKIISN